MRLFLIERNFAEQLQMDAEMAKELARVNDDEGVRWLYSFLGPTKRRPTACTRPPARKRSAAARRVGIPADVVVEVGEVSPDMFG